MKRIIIILMAAATMVVCSGKANAGWFGASFGTEPSITLFGQTLSVPVPSIVIGAGAGTSVRGRVSSDGARISLPFVSIGVRSPKLTVGIKGSKVDVSTSGIKKASHKVAEKRRSTKRKKAPAKK